MTLKSDHLQCGHQLSSYINNLGHHIKSYQTSTLPQKVMVMTLKSDHLKSNQIRQIPFSVFLSLPITPIILLSLLIIISVYNLCLGQINFDYFIDLSFYYVLKVRIEHQPPTVRKIIKDTPIHHLQIMIQVMSQRCHVSNLKSQESSPDLHK